MGEIISFEGALGHRSNGYLARASDPGAPGVVVIQEWWGLIGQITAVCDRLAEAGFTAIAPDLYDGTTVPLHEPDDAAKAMMALKLDEASSELSGAVDVLLEETGRSSVGVIGFCMGGGLALLLASKRPESVAAVVPCYGVHPWGEGAPDLAAIEAATQIHCAGLDDFFTPEAAEQLVGSLAGLGKQVELHLYPDCHHAFANEDRPEVYDEAAAALLFERAVAFLSARLEGS